MCTQLRLRSAWASAHWSESSLCAQWLAKDTRVLHADSEDSDQTRRTGQSIRLSIYMQLIYLHHTYAGWSVWGTVNEWVKSVKISQVLSVRPDRMRTTWTLLVWYQICHYDIICRGNECILNVFVKDRFQNTTAKSYQICCYLGLNGWY